MSWWKKSKKTPEEKWDAKVENMVRENIFRDESGVRVNLSTSSLGDEGCAAVGRYVQREDCRVERLYLNGNLIGDEGANALGEGIKVNGSIKVLGLAGNSIGDEGAKALGAGIKVNGSIKVLGLAGNSIGDEGAEALGEGIKSNPNSALEELHGPDLAKLLGDSIPEGVAKPEGNKDGFGDINNKAILAYLRSIREPAPAAAAPSNNPDGAADPAPSHDGAAARPRPPAAAAAPVAARSYRAKLVFVGEAAAGKTSLAACVTGRDASAFEAIQSTDGLEMIDWSQPHPDGSGDLVHVRIVDFAGQEVYYTTHQLFYSKDAFYVLVLNPRVKHNALAWMRSIHAREPLARVLVVFTRSDTGLAPDVSLEDLRAERPTLRVQGLWHVCAKPSSAGYDAALIAELRSRIVASMLELPRMGLVLATAWLRVAAAVQAQSDPRLSPRGLLPLSEFVRVATTSREYGVGDEGQAEVLARMLHEWGVLLYFPELGELRDVLVPRPQWLSDVLRTVITARANGLEQSNGLVQLARLREIWAEHTGSLGASSEEEKRDELGASEDPLLQVLVQFELAFVLPGREHALVPCLLTASPPTAAQLPDVLEADGVLRLQGEGWRRVARRYTLDVVPASLFPRLVARLHSLTRAERSYRGAVVLEYSGHVGLITVVDKVLTTQAAGPALPESLLQQASGAVEYLLAQPFCKGLKVRRELGCPECYRDKVHEGELPHFFTSETCERRVQLKRERAECQRCFEMASCLDMLDLVHAMSSRAGEADSLRQLAESGQRAMLAMMHGALTERGPSVGLLTDDKQGVQVYCEYPGHMHPVQGEPLALRDPDALVAKAGGHLTSVCAPLLGHAVDDPLPNTDPRTALLALRDELLPQPHGLRRAQLPSGASCWVCPEHLARFDAARIRPLPAVPAPAAQPRDAAALRKAMQAMPRELTAEETARRRTAWLDLVGCRKLDPAFGFNPHDHRHFVFLSHLSRDTKPLVWVLHHALKELGVWCFFDRKELPGVPLGQGIAHALQNAHLCLLFLSPNFSSSEWCKMEAAACLDWGREHMSVFCLVGEERNTGQVPRALMSVTGVSFDAAHDAGRVFDEACNLVTRVLVVAARREPKEEEVSSALRAAFLKRAGAQSDPSEAHEWQRRVDEVAEMLR